MGKLIALVLVVILLAGIVGCSTAPTEAPSMPTTPAIPSPTSDPDVEARLIDRTWISPAMVEVGNYYPGARAEWNIRLHNGGDMMAEFLVSYRVPDYTKEGYDTAPPQAQDWVIIADPTPVLAAKETKEILVVLAMPSVLPKNIPLGFLSSKWEFWISVVEKTGGMVQTEMCSRWLVSMR